VRRLNALKGLNLFGDGLTSIYDLSSDVWEVLGEAVEFILDLDASSLVWHRIKAEIGLGSFGS
jgi:hypothetical protein